MEAVFDNKTNVLNASIRNSHNNSIVYTVTTTNSMWGRGTTYLKDSNPAYGSAPISAAIHWKDRTFEIHGQRKPISDIKRKVGGFRNKSRIWQWSPNRKEFDVAYRRQEAWQVQYGNRVDFAPTVDEPVKQGSNKNMATVASFTVPFRPKLFGKLKPPALHLTRTALAKDEVFLILVLIYSEARRQDRMNSSGGW